MRREYGVLFSHASEATIPGLVVGGFTSLLAASEDGARTALAAGVKFKVMRRQDDGGWADSRGRAPLDLIRALGTADPATDRAMGWQP